MATTEQRLEHTTISGLSSPLLPAPDSGTKLSIDEMLQHHAGELGPWQLRHFVLTSLAWALNAFHTMVVVFADREPEWRCKVYSSACPSTPCGLRPDEWDWVDGPWSSTAAEWGLLCAEKYKVGLAQSAFFAGSMVGAGVCGHLSDSLLGRRGTLTLACAANAVFGCLTALSPCYQAYMASRFFTGVSTGGVGLCAFVLATEPVGPSKRGLIGTSTFYFFSIGVILLAVMAYIFPSWRALYVVTSLPSLLFVVVVIPFVSESPRWYLVHNKISDAMKVMKAIAKRNKTHIPEDVSLTLDCSKIEDDDTGHSGSGTIIDVIQTPMTRVRLILVTTINFVTSIVYYGLSLNVVNLKTSLYDSVVLNGMAEMPAYGLTAIALKWYGRKPLTIGTMWFCGVFCVVGSMLPDAGTWRSARMACGVLGIFAMAATFDLLFVYTAELFPTVVRNAALGCVTQAGQMGAVVAPLVVMMGGRWPFTVFAVCSFVGGVLGLYLPETMNRPLYDTMAGMKHGEVNNGEVRKADG